MHNHRNTHPYARLALIACMVAMVGALCTPHFAMGENAVRGTDVEMLQQELREVERQIAGYEKNLSVTKKQRIQIAGLLSRLKSQRTRLLEQIRISTLSRNSLQSGIDTVAEQIEVQTGRVHTLGDDLRGLIRLIALSTTRTPFESAILYDTFSSYLDEQERMVPIIHVLQLKYRSFKAALHQLGEKKSELEREVRELEHALHKQGIQQQQLGENAKLQTALLFQTKQKEKTTAQQLNESRAKARSIRNRIYELFNVGKQISFGAAYEIAQWASSQYHIRPAFLLAVLTQESNLGKNVGTCNRAGDPVEKHWRAIMKPSRDHEPFLAITKELGLNPDTTPISCPMMRNGKQVGWGGAMGPAQFIPSTWMGYRSKVQAVTGKTPNPWDIRDAFIAAALKLSNDGANSTKKSEFNAALRYFSGSVNLTYRFYGDNVLAIAERYERDIKQLEEFSE